MASFNPELFNQFEPEVMSDRLHFIGAGLLAATTAVSLITSRVAVALGAKEADISSSDYDPVADSTEEDVDFDTLEQL